MITKLNGLFKNQQQKHVCDDSIVAGLTLVKY